MAGITWLIDTDQYTNKQLKKLSGILYDYDYSISKHIDQELEQRAAKEEESKRIRDQVAKVEAEEAKKHQSKKGEGGIPLGRKPKWTPEAIRIEAVKHKLRSDFSKGAPGAYSAAKGFGMMEELFPLK